MARASVLEQGETTRAADLATEMISGETRLLIN